MGLVSDQSLPGPINTSYYQGKHTKKKKVYNLKDKRESTGVKFDGPGKGQRVKKANGDGKDLMVQFGWQ